MKFWIEDSSINSVYRIYQYGLDEPIAIWGTCAYHLFKSKLIYFSEDLAENPEKDLDRKQFIINLLRENHLEFFLWSEANEI